MREPRMYYPSPTVNVEIDATHLGSTKPLYLSGLRTPIDFNDLCNRIVQNGLPKPAGLFTTNRRDIEVTTQPSTYGGPARRINLNQPLLHYYHKCFLPVAKDEGNRARKPEGHQDHLCPSRAASSSELNEALMTNRTEVNVNDALLSFQRTVRVPDNKKTHALPPSMGAFSIHNVAQYAHRLPPSIVEKGGVFISMYQREALWIKFDQKVSSPNLARAVKISVGGVNALTGIPQGQAASGKQDYCVLNSTNAQPWLDGISTAPGVVRQFVAMPLGQGYTVEGQITGKENVGGLQIDVYPELDTSTVEFSIDGSSLSLYKTPRQLGLTVGTYIQMVDRRPTEVPKLLSPSAPFVTSASCLYLVGHSSSTFIHISTWNGEIIPVPYQPFALVSELKHQLAKMKGFPQARQELQFCRQEMKDDRTLISYDIFPNNTVYLQLSIAYECMMSCEKACYEEVHYSEGCALMSPEMGIAAGGVISQKVNRDPLPPVAYDIDNGIRLHVSVLNAAHFSYVAGLPAPTSPITPQTYLKLKLPWYTFYDERVPAANNASPSSALAGVQSIASMEASRRAQGSWNVQPDCGYCSYELATLVLEPCGHLVCDDCAMGLQPSECPSCPRAVRARKIFAAAMPLPGNEDNDGVEAGSLDDRIVALKRCAERGKVGTFKLPKHGVSPLSGGTENTS